MDRRKTVRAATEWTMISLSRVKEEDPIVVKVQGQTQAEKLCYWMGRETKLHYLMRDYCERTGGILEYMRFHVDGSRVNPNKTPSDLGLEDGDIIDANSEHISAVDIYVVIVASLAKRKKGSQLTEFFRNIKGTIDDDDDWDQLLKLHPISFACFLLPTPLCRKVLACVVCGRLKSAFQITSRSGSVTDVQYVAHQALHANALPVLDMCKQWLSQYCNLLLNNIFATCFPTPLLRESDGCFWFPQPTTDNRQRHAI
ncbi:hypothetical protein V6N13_022861 [Hibiscus sabdariffa]